MLKMKREDVQKLSESTHEMTKALAADWLEMNDVYAQQQQNAQQTQAMPSTVNIDPGIDVTAKKK
jgi:hypothetical protein